MPFVVRRDCPAKHVHYLHYLPDPRTRFQDDLYTVTNFVELATNFDSHDAAEEARQHWLANNSGWDAGTWSVQEVRNGSDENGNVLSLRNHG